MGPGWAIHLSARAGLPDPLPRDMVEEHFFARLVKVLFEELETEDAEGILAASGVGTGRYVLRHRIPGFVRLGLRLLPARLSLRVLLSAIRRHAWTFAGSSDFTARMTPDGAEFTLAPSLVCVTAQAGRPMGDYYARAVETLVRALVSSKARVTEEACTATGAERCRFRIVLAPLPSHATKDVPTEDTCASS